MDSASSPYETEPNVLGKARLQRVARTHNFRGGDFGDWTGARLAIIGCGLVGGRLAEEAVLSGACVSIFDPDVGEVPNLGTQRCRVGVLKAESLADRCETIWPGRARAYPCDVRHAGVRPLLACDVWFDCTDDARLAWPLTELSNGLAKPLFRCAVDGSGQWELGRVLCSSGGTGHACQICSYSLDDFLRQPRRTPCPRRYNDSRPPTIAGGAIGAGIAGLALSLAQRLVAGADRDSVLNREFVLDWTNFQMVPVTLRRSTHCLSGHHVWACVATDVAAERDTLRDLFVVAEREMPTRPIALAPYLLPWNVQAYCTCGAVRDVVGTDRASAPRCPTCGHAMHWLTETRIESVCMDQAGELGILDAPLASLGIPAGALVVACGAERPPLRMLLT
jgi:molybdopterin/thiamine biosynthesis adenylyltransferase